MQLTRKTLPQVALIITLASVFVLSPFVSANVGQGGSAAAQGPINFTPHITPLVIPETPVAPRFAAIGPVTAAGLPEVVDPKLLEDPLGYAEILGQPGMYLVWSTDADGENHYFIIDRNNEYFERIRSETDKWRELHAQYVAGEHMPNVIFGGAVFIFTGLVSLGCGFGAVSSAASQVYPLAALFVGCDAIFIPAAGKYLDYTKSEFEQVRLYHILEDAFRREVFGFIKQLPFTVAP